MTSLMVEDFPAYFQSLHGRPPYEWQARLARQVVQGSWPRAIDLPTGSGKTSCLDIAIFALACQAALPKEQRTAPRRIFFCVNRRVIVDEAYQRAVKIAQRIADAEGRGGILDSVASSLRKISTLRPESAPPLDVLELRGGIYRDNHWARSATQPTIVCTTIDQIGSRLLFRGYGVSSNAAPIHAALIAYDSLVLLDEAHISRPFMQTLDDVRRYLDPEKWAEQPIGVKPIVVVPMTATPPDGIGDADVIRLSDQDRENPTLRNRLTASKKAKLVAVPDVVKSAVEVSTELEGAGPTAVGIIVNRVATAKSIYEKLREATQDRPEVVVELVIGSMRPIDRDLQAERLRKLVGPERPEISETTSYVVATQCLEVGADYDFDVLVTECASLDALRQRFGRLNRGGRPIEARAVILAAEKSIKEESRLDDAKPLDPIYGNALTRTWHWLITHAQTETKETESRSSSTRRPKKAGIESAPVIDFGIDAFNAILGQLPDAGRIPSNLLAPSASKNAPVILPAYVDFWCQTSPRPTPDPEVSLFIHGSEAGEPDVQVCWRADLVEDEQLQREDWPEIVALLPPTSAECMTVPISRVRKWLTQEQLPPEGDLLGSRVEPNRDDKRSPRAKVDPKRKCVLWRGSKDSRILEEADDLRPGDTLVLPVSAGGWDDLGHIPGVTPEDVDQAEAAFRTARDRTALRLHPCLRNRLPDSKEIAEFFEQIIDRADEPTTTQLRTMLRPIAEALLGTTAYNLSFYPDNRGVVLVGRRRLDRAHWWIPPETDEGEDEWSQTRSDRPISLWEHTQHVGAEVQRSVTALPLTIPISVYQQVADGHDFGKADERFQAMLRRADRTDAWLFATVENALWAKSDGLPLTPGQRRQARERAGLPDGFRHEMLSVQIIEQTSLGATITDDLDLILHLIASHHGYARPFAPVVFDDECPDVTIQGATLTSEQRRCRPPHRLDSGIAERFWALTRRFGWWGLAYLEAVFRLADQQASSDENEGLFAAKHTVELAGATS